MKYQIGKRQGGEGVPGGPLGGGLTYGFVHKTYWAGPNGVALHHTTVHRYWFNVASMMIPFTSFGGAARANSSVAGAS